MENRARFSEISKALPDCHDSPPLFCYYASCAAGAYMDFPQLGFMMPQRGGMAVVDTHLRNGRAEAWRAMLHPVLSRADDPRVAGAAG